MRPEEEIQNEESAPLQAKARASDPLKPLDKILSQDRDFFPQTIEQRHATISEITVHEGVPLKVQQVFETARNLSLYAFYAYRFHQVAELMAYIAFEMALSQRVQQETPALLGAS